MLGLLYKQCTKICSFIVISMTRHNISYSSSSPDFNCEGWSRPAPKSLEALSATVQGE